MARAAMTACVLDEVWWLVNPAPAHKQGVTSLEARRAMVRLAIAGEAGMREGEPGDYELAAHTMAEFEGLMEACADKDFVFIVGDDVLAGVGAWDQADRVLERVDFAAVRRPGQADVRLDPRLRVQWFDMVEQAEVSSGRVRRALAAGEEPVGLAESVGNYIRERALYRG